MDKPQGKYKIAALKDWVPQKVGFIIFLFFAFVAQITLSVYLSGIEEVASARQFTTDDISMGFQASLIGMVVMFPSVFKIKFRFKSKHILLVAISLLMILSLIAATTTSVVVFVGVSFLLGAIRMLATFESFSSVQLIITPERDFGIFFSFIYTIILVSLQFSGIVSVHLSEWFGWDAMHFVMLGMHIIMLITVLVILKPVHFMPPVPIGKLDWKGMGLWSLLFLSLAYIVVYGETKDWYNSDAIFLATLLACIAAILLFVSYKVTKKPFIEFKVFFLPSVITSSIVIFLMEFFINTGESIINPFLGQVMDLDSITTVDINIWLIAGILTASVFCLWWFAKINGSYKILFFIGFSTLMIYHILVGPVLSADAGKTDLYIPFFFKGIGYLTIYATVGKYMMKDLDFELFPQGWFLVAVVRNAVGAPFVAALIKNWQHYKVENYVEKLAVNMNVQANNVVAYFHNISTHIMRNGASYRDAQEAASSALYGKVYIQSLTLAARDIYGGVTLLGILILIGILLYHFSKPFVVRRFGDRFWKG